MSIILYNEIPQPIDAFPFACAMFIFLYFKKLILFIS